MQADIPDAMIDQQVDSIIRDFGYRLQMQGMSIDSYIKATGMDANSFRAMFHNQAETQVKGRLALQKVAELEKIEISDEDMEKEIASLAEQYNMDVKRVKEIMPADAMREDMKIDRAVELVKKSAKAIKKTAEAKED